MQNQLIKKTQVNINVCKQAIFYWKDSHEVYLTFARRDPERRDFWVKKAKGAREQIARLKDLIRFAQGEKRKAIKYIAQYIERNIEAGNVIH